jgi:hypothetical protein
MVKSDLKKSISFKSYSENSESPSKEFLINMSIFVLQRHLYYEYWAICYEVYLLCYVSRPLKIHENNSKDFFGNLSRYLKIHFFRAEKNSKFKNFLAASTSCYRPKRFKKT